MVSKPLPLVCSENGSMMKQAKNARSSPSSLPRGTVGTSTVRRVNSSVLIIFRFGGVDRRWWNLLQVIDASHLQNDFRKGFSHDPAIDHLDSVVLLGAKITTQNISQYINISHSSQISKVLWFTLLARTGPTQRDAWMPLKYLAVFTTVS